VPEFVLVVALLVAYAIGSIPSGFLVARRAGLSDIRQHGSGNIGATNILRTLGWRAALPVLLLDALKGVLGVALLRVLGGSPEWQALGGVAAMAGHIWPWTLGFRGGRGVATGFGVMLALDPLAGAVGALTFVLVVALSRYVSLGSIVSGIPAAAVLLLRGGSLVELLIVSCGVAVIIWRHRPNIERLLAGTESRFSLRPKPAVPPPSSQPAHH
jgi:glycerol-3-phosphate acyltransferase PlsY